MALRQNHYRMRHSDRAPASWRVLIRLGETNIPTRLRNISPGGAQVILDRPVKRDHELWVALRPPGHGGQRPTHIRARVCYCFLQPRNGVYAVGLEFLNLDDQAREMIEQFVVTHEKALSRI